MTTMAAARLHDPRQRFRVDRVPVPKPTGYEVLVRVRACGIAPNLNNVIRYAEILPDYPLPELPATYGLDPAGEIVAVGPEVLELTPGMRVYVNPGRSCGSCPECRGGRPVECDYYTLAGYFGLGPKSGKILKRYPQGGFAEYMVAPASSLVVLPNEVSFEEAARFGYLGTAYAALRRAAVGPDTSVLINGATGFLGAGAVLVALAMGVPKILAVARDKRLLSDLVAIAPRRIVAHSNDSGSCTDWAREQTDGRGPNVVIQALGPGSTPSAIWDAMLSIARGGRIVTIGGVIEGRLEIDPTWIMVNQITWMGSVWFTTGQGEELARMAAAGALDLTRLVHRRFPLDQVSSALEASQLRDIGGLANVVVMP